MYPQLCQCLLHMHHQRFNKWTPLYLPAMYLLANVSVLNSIHKAIGTVSLPGSQPEVPAETASTFQDKTRSRCSPGIQHREPPSWWCERWAAAAGAAG